MPDRPADQPDLNPARVAADPLLREIAEMVGYMDLHIGRHQIKQMTTRQKELWADLVDADSVLDENENPTDGPARRSVRWWRERPVRPWAEEGHRHGEEAVCRGCGKAITWDADFEKFWIPYKTGNPSPETFHCAWGEPHWALPSGVEEPDPFLYVDETDPGTGQPGQRTREIDRPAQAHHFDEAAARVARAAVLDVIVDPSHPHRLRLAEDFAAIYEWAKRCVVPMRKTIGQHAGQIGVWVSYPSLEQARAFLDGVRAARAARRTAG